MRVYRVSHKTLRGEGGFPLGPYADRSGMHDVVPDEEMRALGAMSWAHDYDTHPSPYLDAGITDFTQQDVCAFRSLESLRAWFEPHWRVLLDAVGFQVEIYDVPAEAVQHGEAQSVFKRAEGRCVGAQSLLSV